MSIEENSGLLVSLWVLATMPRFLWWTFKGDASPGAFEFLWILGFTVLLLLSKAGFSLEVELWWTAGFWLLSSVLIYRLSNARRRRKKLMLGLERMIGSPETTPERRQWAVSRLQQFKDREEKRLS